MNPFLGARVIASNDVGSRHEWIRKPRSKAKRIRKKWRNDRRNWKWVERPEFYQMADGTIITNEMGAHKLRLVTSTRDSELAGA